MRLIDADAFKAEGRELYRCAGWDLRDVHYSQMDVECNIDYMPTIEAEPIKHGRWKAWDLTWGRSIYVCTSCGDAMEVPTENGKPIFAYCPNCGADMRGGEND